MLLLLLPLSCRCPPTATRALVAGPAGIRVIDDEDARGALDDEGALWSWNADVLEREGEGVRDLMAPVGALVGIGGSAAFVDAPWPGIPSYYEPADTAEGEELPLSDAYYDPGFMAAVGDERWILSSSRHEDFRASLLHRAASGEAWQSIPLGEVAALVPQGLAVGPDSQPILAFHDGDQTRIVTLDGAPARTVAASAGPGIVLGGDGHVWVPVRQGLVSTGGCEIVCSECATNSVAAFADEDAVGAIGVNADGTFVAYDVDAACGFAVTTAKSAPAGVVYAWGTGAESGTNAFLSAQLTLHEETDEFDVYTHDCK